MACEKIYLMTLGYEHMPRNVLFEGVTDQRPLRMPLSSVLARSDGRWYLFDTGLGPEFRETAFSRQWYKWGDPELPGDEPDPLDGQLKACGLALDDVDVLVTSHFHADHAGGIRRFSDGRPVYIQRSELEYGMSTATRAGGYLREHYEDSQINWHCLDGDAAIAPGITAIYSPGHTPGHQSFLIELDSGDKYLFPFDAIPTIRNIEWNAPLTAAAEPEQRPMIGETQEKLVRFAEREGARILPGHCPWTWPAVPDNPVLYQ